MSAHGAGPELAAVHFCLTSSSHLLKVSRSLVEQTAGQSAIEQTRLNRALADEIKAAGHAAYRAALILSEMSEPAH